MNSWKPCSLGALTQTHIWSKVSEEQSGSLEEVNQVTNNSKITRFDDNYAWYCKNVQ